MNPISRWMKPTVKIMLVVFCSIVFSSCQQVSDSIKQTYEPQPDSIPFSSGDSKRVKNETTSEMDLIQEQNNENKKLSVASHLDSLSYVEQALRTLPEFAGESIVLHGAMHFYGDGRVITDIQNPQNPLHIDEYRYRDGQWEKRNPVRLSQSRDWQRDLLPLDSVDFNAAYRVYHTVIEKQNEIGSTDVRSTVYMVPGDDTTRWYPTRIKNDRENYNLKFDRKGNLLHFELD